jgi:hypothetical protein
MGQEKYNMFLIPYWLKNRKEKIFATSCKIFGLCKLEEKRR